MKLKVGKETVLIIPDTQYPFQHPDTVPFLAALKKKYRPTKVVHIGDMFDQHSMSDYDIDPDGWSTGDEFLEAEDQAQELYGLFPKVSLLESNHDRRLYKKAYKAGIPRRFIPDYLEVIGAPRGWTYHERVTIDGVLFEHGERFGGQTPAVLHAKSNMRSTVVGHHHSKFSINYFANDEELVFGMSVGSLMDYRAYAMAYAKRCPQKAVQGTGVIVRGQPILHPMLLKDNGRWVGEL